MYDSLYILYVKSINYIIFILKTDYLQCSSLVNNSHRPCDANEADEWGGGRFGEKDGEEKDDFQQAS